MTGIEEENYTTSQSDKRLGPSIKYNIEKLAGSKDTFFGSSDSSQYQPPVSAAGIHIEIDSSEIPKSDDNK